MNQQGPADTWSEATFAQHLATVDIATAVLRRTVNRLDAVQTTDDAIAALRQPRNCMYLLWAMACWMREPRYRRDPQTLLTELLTHNPSRRAITALRNAFSILTSLRISYHPNTMLALTNMGIEGCILLWYE